MAVHKLSLTRLCESEDAQFTPVNKQSSAETQRSQRVSLWANTNWIKSSAGMLNKS
ncbi:MAG: hypothetical protein ACOCPM_01330 [Bacteroidales bacterium]